MTTQALGPLPLGCSSIAEIRRTGAIFVDKTDLLKKFAHSYSFFGRPAHFGHTLLIDMLESLLKYGVRDFKGLKIENLWHEKIYNVLRLNFSTLRGFDSVEEFQSQFERCISESMANAGLALASDEESSADKFIWRFSATLRRLQVASIVLLIDFYDAPLLYCRHDQSLFTHVRQHILAFFDHIKAESACMHAILVTGTEPVPTTIFSGFNILTDRSADPTYSSLLGFTEDELRLHFGDHIRRAAGILGIGFDECIAELKKRCGPYNFEEQFRFAKIDYPPVFDPTAVLQFLDDPRRDFASPAGSED